jgi:hypothetical protein
MGKEEIRPTRPTLVVSPTGCCLSKIKIKKGLRINIDRNSKEKEKLKMRQWVNPN